MERAPEPDQFGIDTPGERNDGGLLLGLVQVVTAVPVGLTERVVCDPTIRPHAGRLPGNRAATSWLGDATSPVVLHYRVLGVTMSQTVTVAMPILVALPYRSCK
jgi:hypothetical protein